MRLSSRWAALSVSAAWLGALVPGCGAPLPEFPNAIVNQDGVTIFLEDVETIVDDDDLTDDQKREALRDLGIEDEELIDALLTL